MGALSIESIPWILTFIGVLAKVFNSKQKKFYSVSDRHMEAQFMKENATRELF